MRIEHIETWDMKYARRRAAHPVIEREIIDNRLIVEKDPNSIIIEERTD